MAFKATWSHIKVQKNRNKADIYRWYLEKNRSELFSGLNILGIDSTLSHSPPRIDMIQLKWESGTSEA